MAAVVLDASVIIALFDPSDSLHASCAEEVRRHRLSGATMVVPASVLAEVLVGAAKRGDMDAVSRSIVDAFGPVRHLDEEVAVAAALRRAQHPTLRLPDALVLATADVLGAATVLTGDRRWRHLDRRVVVIVETGVGHT